MTDGIALAHGYYRDVVAPLLLERWPRLPHAGGCLGGGSEVLGLDDDTSRDHDWGLRLTLLVQGDLVRAVEDLLDERLPQTHAGLPTRFATTGDPVVRQRVEVTTAEEFVASRLGLDASGALTGLDWLCLTGQSLLEVTAGRVFADDLGTITRLRQELAWYPDAVWRYVLATDWIRLGDDLPLLGRAGQRGDDLGSRVICARIVDTAVHLAFLVSRRWQPYPKWRGTVLGQLPVAHELLPALTRALAAEHWSQRQEDVARALAVLHRAQSSTGLTTGEGLPTEPFYDRPFLGVRASVADLLMSGVEDPLVRSLPPGVGSVEQWVDNVRVLTEADHRVRAARSALAVTSQPAGWRPTGEGPGARP